MINESKIIEYLDKYNLRDGLIETSRLSQFIFLNGENGFCFVNEHINTSQEALAYITRLFILSKANDDKRRCISAEPEIFTQLINQVTKFYYSTDDNDCDLNDPDSGLIKLMFKFYKNQFELQEIDIKTLLVRSKLIYEEGFKTVNAKNPKFNNILEDFQMAHRGLSLSEFLKISFLITRISLEFDARNSNFYQGYIHNIQIEDAVKKRNPDLFQESKFNQVLELLSCNYDKFKELDLSTPLRSPLRKYPLIKPKKARLNSKQIYLLPSYPLFYLRVFDQGLFDFFDDHYASEDRSRRAFRSYFGDIYEQYVLKIFQKIFGKDTVSPINTDSKHADYKIIQAEKIYIIEVKSFAINSFRSLEEYQSDKKFIDDDIQKIQTGINQLKFSCEEEIKKNPQKTIIPLMVLNNSAWLLISHRDQGSIKIKQDFVFRYLNFNNVEKYFDALKSKDLYLDESPCSSLSNEASFRQVDQEGSNHKNPIPGNKYFDEIVDQFYRSEILS